MKFSELCGKKCLGIISINEPNLTKMVDNDEYISTTPEYDEDVFFYLDGKKCIKQFYMLIGEPEDEITKFKPILFLSVNQRYSYYDNWMIIESSENVKIDTDFKYIGEIINEVWTDGYDINTNFIQANSQKWIDSVGGGKYLAKEDVPYKFISIKMNTKHIDLTSMYHDCHYPESIWMFV